MDKNSGGWYVEIYYGPYGSPQSLSLIGTSCTAPSNEVYDTFTRVVFNPAVPTIPGHTYTLRPRGNGQWFINNQNMYSSGALTGCSPVNSCWSSVYDSAFHVNCGTRSPTPWTCYPGIDVPLRENVNGDIECMATDGANCLWNAGNCAGVLAQYATATLEPLTCGANHRALYGIPGYDDSTHWCYKGWEFLYPWLCLPGQTCPMRLNSKGNVECLSSDGANCAWGSVSCTVKTEYDASSFSPQNPLACGAAHMALYGMNGYSSTTHWCYNGIQQLEPQCITNNQVTFCSGTSCTGTYPCPLSGS